MCAVLKRSHLLRRGAIELVNALEQAAGKRGQLAHRLIHVDLVILDELGYLPFSPSGGVGQFPDRDF